MNLALGGPLRVVVLDDFQNVARGFAEWGAIGPDLELTVLQEHIADEDDLVEAVRGAEVIVAMRERTPLSRLLLERLPEARLVITTGARNASIDPPPHVLFCGTRSLVSPTAELTWALLFAAKRQLGVELESMKVGRWQSTVGEGIEGQTLGIIGLGAVGSRVAAVARSFGMAVLAWSENLTAEDATERGAELVEFDELLVRSDVISIHTRLSDRTRGLIAAREFELMGPRSLLLNTSRAEIVDQGALLSALHSGVLGGAALDVYETEPLPPEHPLRSAPRTVLTPHLGYVTRQNYELFFGDVVEDIIAYRAGTPVRVITS